MNNQITELNEFAGEYLQLHVDYPCWSALENRVRLALLAGAKLDIAVLLDHSDEINAEIPELSWAICEQAVFLARKLRKSPDRKWLASETVEGVGSRTYREDPESEIEYSPRARRLIEQYQKHQLALNGRSVELNRG